MPHENYLKVILLAAVSDGEIQTSELAMINRLKQNHPIIRNISDANAQRAAVDVYNKISAGMNVKYILDELKEQLTEREQHVAYALAQEVIATDFKLDQKEKDFISNLESYWNIPKEVIDVVTDSVNLRYFG